MTMNKTFDKSIVSNPRIFKENRVDAHSGHRFYEPGYENEKNIIAQDYCAPDSDHSLMRSLNGIWKVFVVKNPSLIPEDFYKNDFDISGFSDINVPAHIQIEGFDKKAYVNYQYPWDGVEDVVPGQMPMEYNPVACYVNYFDIKDIKAYSRYLISFDGVEANVVLWINGEYVGYAEDAFTTSEFDITDYIKEGKNKIAALVYKWCGSCFVDDQDFFRFSGIFRDVTLVMHKNVHINDISVTTDLDESYEDAVLNVALKLEGDIKEGMRIRYSLAFEDRLFLLPVLEGDVEAASNVKISEKVENPAKWSAEKPNLYRLSFEIYSEAAISSDEYDTDGGVIEKSELKVGFRKFEMIDGIMCLNGKRIVFNGVNRHEFSAVSGRAISYEDTKYDIINMKKNNINALRTCHYPDAEFVYDLCDEYGLYVICETNMESHGSWANIYAGLTTKEKVVPGDNPDFAELIIDRATSMIEKEKNHPSIIIWSCGNESFGGSNIYNMSNHMRKLDPTRLIHYEGIFHDRRYNETSDMESQMYPSVKQIEEYLAENKEKPFICCEYSHAMGNSCGAMFKYTDLAKREPRYQGGFIWDYIDQAIETENIFGEKYMGYGGDFGERPCDYEFSGNGICYADRSDSPKMPSVKYNYQPADFRVEMLDGCPVIYAKNLNLFTDFSEYNIDAEIAYNGEIIEVYDVLGDINTLEPGKEAHVIIDAGFEDYDSYDEIDKTYWYRRILDDYADGVLTFTVNLRLANDTNYGEEGDLVGFYEYREELTKKAFGDDYNKDEDLHIVFSEYTQSELDCFRVIKGGYNLGVRGENFSALFTMLNGGLSSYVYNGKEYIDILPRPNFWRAPTDNDRGNQMPFRYAQWKIASDYQVFREPAGGPTSVPATIEEHKDKVIVTYTYYLPTVPASKIMVAYTVRPNGVIDVKMDYPHVDGLIEMPEFGMLFRLPHSLKNVSWLGLGPQETYADRKQGAKFRIYSNKVEDNFAKYLRPQECGNHTDVYSANVTDERGHGIEFRGYSMNFSALPYTPDEIECALHPYELKRSDHTVVRVSMAQMGIAGDDTWGALTHPEFLLPNDRDLTFEFSFKGI